MSELLIVTGKSWCAPVVFAIFAACVSVAATAADPLGLYAGAGAGQARVRVDQLPGFVSPVQRFNQTDTGWTAFAGIRPISALGAELQYLDFGHPSSQPPLIPESAKAHAMALFAVGYLPLPLPMLDVYGKAGVGRLETVFNEHLPLLTLLCVITHPNCQDVRVQDDSTRFAWGAGAQVHVSSFALRAEYVRFNSRFGDPDLLSVSLLWTFR